jgi:hypothetical protein
VCAGPSRLYVAAILVGNSLATLWPHRFYTPAFWVLKQGVYDLLKIAVGIELAWRAFRGLPGRVAHRARG